MWCAALLSILSAGPQLAVLPFSTVDVAEGRGQVASEHLATRLIEAGVQVTTPKDLNTLLGFERQRQLLGCSASDCLTELAGALGVKTLVHGELVRVGAGYRLLVKVLSADTGQVRFARSEAARTEEAVFELIDRWAPEIAGKPAPVTRSLAPLVPVAVGGAAMAVGAGFLISAGAQYGALEQRDPALAYPAAVTARAEGERNQWLGVAFAGAGAAAVAAGLIWWAASAPSAPTAWVVPTPQGLAAGGVW